MKGYVYPRDTGMFSQGSRMSKMQSNVSQGSRMSKMQSVLSDNSRFSGQTGMNSENTKAFVDQKVKRIQNAFDKTVADIKPFLFSEAIKFVKESNASVCQLFSKQHHILIK
jgi:hypothetical protein